MWLYGSGNDGLPPIRLYDYQPSRGGYHAEEFLKGFSGYLTCDGFSGYNELKDVIRCGCLIIPGFFEPPVRILRATIPENESHAFR